MGKLRLGGALPSFEASLQIEVPLLVGCIHVSGSTSDLRISFSFWKMEEREGSDILVKEAGIGPPHFPWFSPFPISCGPISSLVEKLCPGAQELTLAEL